MFIHPQQYKFWIYICICILENESSNKSNVQFATSRNSYREKNRVIFAAEVPSSNRSHLLALLVSADVSAAPFRSLAVWPPFPPFSLCCGRLDLAKVFFRLREWSRLRCSFVFPSVLLLSFTIHKPRGVLFWVRYRGVLLRSRVLHVSDG